MEGLAQMSVCRSSSTKRVAACSSASTLDGRGAKSAPPRTRRAPTTRQDKTASPPDTPLTLVEMGWGGVPGMHLGRGTLCGVLTCLP